MIAKKRYTAILAIPNMDDTTVDEARRLFFAYRDSGVIRESMFDDPQWRLTDEYANYTLNFSLKENEFKEFGELFSISANDFILYLKAYLVCQMGNYSLGALQSIVHIVKSIVRSPVAQIENAIDEHAGNYIGKAGEFFSMLPSENREEAIEWIANCFDEAEGAAYSRGGQRNLAPFESYFRFDDVLKRFWKESTDENEKLFYFPVWLWWNVSAILPLRPREFVLTPRNCISEVGSEYKLAVRRNQIKGSGKTKSYKISRDYKTFQYTVPEKLAGEIIRYQDATEKFMANDINTLLIADTHYTKWGRCRPYTSRYFTYINLKTCLRYFFEQIVQERYGYRIIFDREVLSYDDDKEINYLHLGDTRHLAMINLILEGATPMVAMMLAGHDNETMASHYFSNITKLVECRTYRQYKKMIKGQETYRISGATAPLTVKEFVLLDDGGQCYSQKVRAGDYSDCCNVSGPSGEIGYCKDCMYYREKGGSFGQSKDRYANRIESEWIMLCEIVSKVRSGRGEPEEIIQSLLRLKAEEYSYQQYLLETALEGEKQKGG